MIISTRNMQWQVINKSIETWFVGWKSAAFDVINLCKAFFCYNGYKIVTI